MALIKFGGGVSEIRGSIGGTVFSRGPAGAIARQRVKAINPATNLQTKIRAVFSALVQQWSSALDVAERAAWAAYAAGTNFLNKVGETIQVTGLACFVRSNTLRQQMGVAITQAAPTGTGQASGVVTSVSAAVATQLIDLSDPSSGFAKGTVGEYLLVYVAVPMAAGRASSPRGWRYAGSLAGSVVPPNTPFTFASPYVFIAGQQIGVSITHIDAAGRVSAPVDTVVVAA